MRLARNIHLLRAQGPVAALTSQNEAAKALTTIIRGDGNTPKKGGKKRKRRARGADAKAAVRLVQDAAGLLRRIERELSGTATPSYHIRHAVQTLQVGRDELEMFLAGMLVDEEDNAPEEAAAAVARGVSDDEPDSGGRDDAET